MKKIITGSLLSIGIASGIITGLNIESDDFKLLENDVHSNLDLTNITDMIGTNNLKKLVKISSDGKSLPDDAKDWACTYTEYMDNGSLKKVLWEVKTKDESFRDMRWTYSYYDSNDSWNDSQGQSVHGYKVGLCKKKGSNVESHDCSSEDYSNSVNEINLCGVNTWRVPVMKELSSIIVCQKGFKPWEYAGVKYWDPGMLAMRGYQCEDDSYPVQINEKFFPNTYSASDQGSGRSFNGIPLAYYDRWQPQYVSKTEYKNIPGSRWFANFATGEKTWNGASSFFSLRLIANADKFNLDVIEVKKSCPIPPGTVGICSGVYLKEKAPDTSVCEVYSTDQKDLAGKMAVCNDGVWKALPFYKSFCEIPDGYKAEPPCESKYISDNSKCVAPNGKTYLCRNTVWEQIETEKDVFKIGDQGPAGGIIISVNADGIHGLEVMKKDSSGIGRNGVNFEGALKIAEALGNGWRVPTKDELNKIYLNKALVGIESFKHNDFDYNVYWSSTELDSQTAWYQSFGNGFQGNLVKKYNSNAVRMIRNF
jgi:hypothetical protein